MRLMAAAIVARPADASSRRRRGAGSPAVSVATLGSTDRPSWSSGRRAAELLRRHARACRDRRSRRARGSRRRRPATSGRHHSAATGGCASAFASATSHASSGCSSARPQTTRAFGGAHRRRKSHLRRSRLEQRHLAVGQRRRERNARRAAARADVDRSGRRTARRSAQPAAHPRAASRAHARRSRSAVRPGVATTAREPVSVGKDDDVAIRLRALGRGRRRRRLPSGAGGRPCARPPSSARAPPARPTRRTRSATSIGERLERRLAPGAVAGRVDDDVLASPRRRRGTRSR